MCVIYVLTRSISGDLKYLSVINLKRTGNYWQRYGFYWEVGFLGES
jgi:hypothetical protein